jgi:tetratricopeptide (TPR) repeat protein
VSNLAFEHLAASVADGDEVDWAAREIEAGTEQQRRILRDLRVIAGIAAFCRTQAGDEPPLPVVPPDPAEGSQPPLGRWGPFDLIQQIGEGAFGNVYRARDALHRDVALKLLRQSSGRSAEQQAARILHEGRVLARVRHPSVVTVYGAEEHDGRVGLWMEFIEGRTLEALLRVQGAFGAREAALIGRELCRALAAVHGAGLVHRDIKAQNVMREAGGRLVLMDFGAGQVMQDEPRAGHRVTGTPLYLAPELLTGSPASVRSDIYSLGVLLYHLVTGGYPVQAGDLEQLRHAHATGARRRLTDVRPDLPEDFVRVVHRALDGDPARRYASAGAMADALSQTLTLDTWGDTTRPDEGRATTPGAVKRFFRRPVAWVAALAVVAALGAGLWVVLTARPPAAATASRGQTLRLAVRAGASGEPAITSLLRDQLAQHLAVSPSLRMIAPAAVEALRDRPASALMQSLEAEALVEVSGVPDASGVVGTARVTRGSRPASVITGRAWYAFDLRGLARELAGRVVDELEVGDDAWRPSMRSELPLDNPDAIRAFRQGQAALERGGRDDVLSAAEGFRGATTLAPDFVLAYAKWAEALLSVYRHNALAAEEAFPVAQDAIAQALRRDEGSGEAYAALADLQVEKDRDWTRAEATFRKAIELSPSSEYARIRFAMMLAGRGRTSEAVTQILEAQSLNPRSSSLRGYAGAALHYAGRYPEAVRMFEGTLQLDSQYSAAWIGLCKAHTALGRFVQAVDACEQVRKLGATEPTFVESQLVQVYADAGRATDARRHLSRLERLYKDAPNGDTAFWLALAHVSLGEKDAAFKWLDEAIAQRSSRLLYARVDSRLDPIRDDPRYREREAVMDVTTGRE